MVAGRFLADPPDVRLSEPSPAHPVAKRAFEVDRLRSWFGDSGHAAELMCSYLDEQILALDLGAPRPNPRLRRPRSTAPKVTSNWLP
jgi:hypothetical protein